MVDRNIRISEEFKKEISLIIQNELKDPRLTEMVSVTSVNVTRDLRYAKVFFSVLGEEEQKKKVLNVLKNAAGFLRREMGKRIELRYNPEILFEIDNSIERGIYMTHLIDKTIKNSGEENES